LIKPESVHFGGPTIVFLTEPPSLFIAASFPPDTRYVSIGTELDLRAGNHSTLTRQLSQELASVPHFELEEVDSGKVPSGPAAVLASYGLFVTDNCRPLDIANETFRTNETFRICAVARRPWQSG
jgi:hypothetical protein